MSQARKFNLNLFNENTNINNNSMTGCPASTDTYPPNAAL